MQYGRIATKVLFEVLFWVRKGKVLQGWFYERMAC